MVGSLLLSAFGPAGYTGSDGTGPYSPGELQGIVADGPPLYTAHSALLMDVETQRVLWSEHAEEQRAPASLTKLMTALLLLESGRDLDQVITVSARAATTPGSTMGLMVGARVRLGDLLAGMLLPSGNDAAVAVAEAVDGTVEHFVAHMDERGRELGLTSTRFRNVEGLDVVGHVSSATDLARVALQDLKYPRFADIVRTPSLRVTAPDGVMYDLVNLNQLLGSYPGSDGVKTGTTPAAGQNLIATVTRNGHRLLLVIMGSDDRYQDARMLLDFGWGHWQWRLPNLPPFATAPIPQPDGTVVSAALALRPAALLPIPAWYASPLGYHVSFSSLANFPAGPLGGDIGTAAVLIGDDVLSTRTVSLGFP